MNDDPLPPMPEGVIAAPPLVASPARGATIEPRLLQFGGGNFLRGFFDVYVQDAARAAGRTDGRPGPVAVATSTGRGPLRGVLDGQVVRYHVCELGRRIVEVAALHCVINARHARSESRPIWPPSGWEGTELDWGFARGLAADPELTLWVSNVTEAALLEPPEWDGGVWSGFPRNHAARVLDLLARRAARAPESTLTILCTELTAEPNGPAFERLLCAHAPPYEELAAYLAARVFFPATLVDRIVTGAPAPERRAAWERVIGRADRLLVEAEPYRFFGIEPRGSPHLDWLHGLEGVHFCDDLDGVRRRKLTLLNAPHSALAAVGTALGLETVAEAMHDSRLARWRARLWENELLPTLAATAGDARPPTATDGEPNATPVAGAPADAARAACDFARATRARLGNRAFCHRLADLLLEHTSKLRARFAAPLAWHRARGRVPPATAFALAASGFLLAHLHEGAAGPELRVGERRLPFMDARAARLLAAAGADRATHAAGPEAAPAAAAGGAGLAAELFGPDGVLAPEVADWSELRQTLAHWWARCAALGFDEALAAWTCAHG